MIENGDKQVDGKDGATPEKKVRKRRAAGTSSGPDAENSENDDVFWKVAALRKEVVPKYDGQLIIRYLSSDDGGKLTKEELCRITGEPPRILRQIAWGRAKACTAKTAAVKLAVHLGIDFLDLLVQARDWHLGDDAADLMLMVRSAHGDKEKFAFKKSMLEKMGLKFDALCVVRQDNDLLLGEGIRTDDILLVNKADREFSPMGIYALDWLGKIWVAAAYTATEGEKLALDPAGRRIAYLDFKEVLAANSIIGRCVWRAGKI
jgi:hypothetical protein